jgi:hypothetical protein
MTWQNNCGKNHEWMEDRRGHATHVASQCNRDQSSSILNSLWRVQEFAKTTENSGGNRYLTGKLFAGAGLPSTTVPCTRSNRLGAAANVWLTVAWAQVWERLLCQQANHVRAQPQRTAQASAQEVFWIPPGAR